jgi:hypothetical protein
MLVELGGEGMACGINLKSGKPWQLGILDPNSTRDNQFFKAYVSLTDQSFTTSGNYFNYREVDGKNIPTLSIRKPGIRPRVLFSVHLFLLAIVPRPMPGVQP